MAGAGVGAGVGAGLLLINSNMKTCALLRLQSHSWMPALLAVEPLVTAKHLFLVWRGRIWYLGPRTSRGMTNNQTAVAHSSSDNNILHTFTIIMHAHRSATHNKSCQIKAAGICLRYILVVCGACMHEPAGRACVMITDVA